MGYSTNSIAVVRMVSTLDKLMAAGGVIIIPTADPRKLAYNIRNAIHAAKVNDMAPYCDLAGAFKVKEDHANGVVICERYEYARPLGTLQAQVDLPDGTHPVAILSLIEENGHVHERIRLHHVMPPDQLKMLYLGLQAQAPEWKIAVNEQGVLITREEGFTGESWSPDV